LVGKLKYDGGVRQCREHSSFNPIASLHAVVPSPRSGAPGGLLYRGIPEAPVREASPEAASLDLSQRRAGHERKPRRECQAKVLAKWLRGLGLTDHQGVAYGASSIQGRAQGGGYPHEHTRCPQGHAVGDVGSTYGLGHNLGLSEAVDRLPEVVLHGST
jgi:hypothetical protein